MTACKLEVKFSGLYPWAVLPRKRAVDASQASSGAKLIRDNFRYFRANRVPELCWPWRAAQSFGWDILSPVDVTLIPFDDIEVPLEIDTDTLRELSSATGFAQFWNRPDSRIAVRNGDWMRVYDFQTGSGWQSMFIPNGKGSVEWVMGWSVTPPEGYVAFILPNSINDGGILVESGILTRKVLDGLCVSGVGMSLAISVRHKTYIGRGQPLARIIFLSEDSLNISEAT